MSNSMEPYVASHLKNMNRHMVYNLISELGTASKAQISKLTGISMPTVMKIASFLVEEGLVLDLGEGKSTVGRKPHILSLNRDRLYTAAFFLEGELLNFGILDIAGEVKHKKEMRCEMDFQKILAEISDGLVEGLFAEADINLEKLMGIGIALPGVYDLSLQTIHSAPMIGLREPVCLVHFIRDMERRYNVPVLVENDVNCQCYGEFKATKMPVDSDLLLVSVGTGIGAGVILNGKLRHGAHYMCGEIGFMSFRDDYRFDWSSPGWLESKISFRALKEKVGVSYGMDLTNVPESMVDAVVDYISNPLALCIFNMAMMIDCPNIRLSGLMIDFFGDRLVDRVNRKLRQMHPNKATALKRHSDDIGLIGVATMLTEKLVSQILTENNDTVLSNGGMR